MTKLEMAHDWYMNTIDKYRGLPTECHIRDAWLYADAMQAEADKREQEASEKSIKEINDILENHEHIFVDGRICWCGKIKSDLEDEWQPDWSAAPLWANYWVKSRGCVYLWIFNKPTMTEDYFASHGKAQIAPSFGYQGSWENSLRKRP